MDDHKKIASKIGFFFNKRLFLSLLEEVSCSTFVMSNGRNDLTKKRMRNGIATQPGFKTSGMPQVWLSVCLLFAAWSGQAQGWEVLFGGSREDQGIAILQTADQGYLQVGWSESFGSDGDIDIYVVRTDVDGTRVWEKFYDPGFLEQPSDVVELDNNRGFTIAGYASPNPGDPSQVYLLSIANNGNIAWSRHYDNNGVAQRANKIARTADGGYIIIGQTENPVQDEFDILVIKVDADGVEEWRESYDNNRDDQGIGIVPVSGGYVFAANVKNLQGVSNIAIYQIDETGGFLSAQVFGAGNNDSERINDLIQTQDGNLLWVGSVANDNKAFVAKSNLNGDTLWTQQLDVALFDDVLQSVIEEEDGSIVAVGLTAPTAAQISGLLVKLNADGQVQWTRSLGFQDRLNFGVDVAPTIDGGYVIGGYNALSVLVLFNDMIFFRVDAEGYYYSNRLTGKVFWPQNGCRPYQDGDPLMSGWLVRAESDDLTFVGTTDANGNYDILVDTGLYTVTLLPPNSNWEVCNPVAYISQFETFYDTTVYNFPVGVAFDCPFMEVNVTTSPVIECSNATYSISFCNLGPAQAQDAYVEVVLDEELSFLSASITPSTINGDTLIFPLGDVASYECGSFTLQAAVACEGITMGQAVLVQAHIFPDTLCQPPSAEWDGSELRVTGSCENGVVKFQIRNEGASMTEIQRYIVTEDVVVFFNGDFILPGGEEESFETVATGATYRIIAEQAPGSPSGLYRTIAVEGCTENSTDDYTVGVLAQFPESDQEAFIDIDVQEILGSTETILLQGHPKGYQDSVITPTTDLEYTVFFTNTGTDTVSRVVIRDTLPAALDLSTLHVGPASHPYEFTLYNEGILKITFEGIHLTPDGSTGEANSQGYVKFRLSQKPTNTLGTVIENGAAVFFDYVEPVYTNVERHVVGCSDFIESGCILVAIDPTPSPVHDIRVYPNPFGSSVTFDIEGCECPQLELRVYDALGRVIRSERPAGPKFEFFRQGLAPGLYLYELRDNNHLLISSGKFFAQ